MGHKKNKTAISTWLLSLLVLLATPLLGQAQSFPDKPIKILIPFTPGGGTDFVSRVVGTKLAELTGWQIILENRPGAGGNLAVEAAAKAPADGYTLVMGQTDNMMLGPFLYTNLTYDTVKSFEAVVKVSDTPAAIVTSATSNLKTPADLVAKGKTAEGLRWSTAGSGTLGHLIGEDFKQRTGTAVLQVPYKGASPALTDVLGGNVDLYIGTLTGTIPFVNSGKMTLVAVATAKRAELFPNVPTLDETVAQGMDAGIWMGLFAPAGTPASVVATINKEVNRVLQTPEVIEKMKEGGISVGGGSPKSFADFVAKDYANWGRLVKASGVKLN
jgi:tripartite-type tricarboxylate transporter receptor subunit TctC